MLRGLAPESMGTKRGRAMVGQIRLFTSHRWSYSEDRQGIARLLSPEWQKNIDYIELSIPQAHPLETCNDREVAVAIRERMECADILLVTAGMYYNFSAWMPFEVDCAFALRVPIIPVAPHHQQKLPRELMRFASCEPIAWRGESIRRAIWQNMSEQQRRDFIARRREAAGRQNALLYAYMAIQAGKRVGNRALPNSLLGDH